MEATAGICGVFYFGKGKMNFSERLCGGLGKWNNGGS